MQSIYRSLSGEAMTVRTNDQKRHALRAFLRGSSKLLYTSSPLGWPYLLIEQHELAPCEWPQGWLDSPVLCFWNSKVPMRCDHPDANGKFVPKLVPPGTLSLYNAGALPRVRPCSPTPGLLCALDQGFFAEILDEIEGEGNNRSVADGVITQDKRCFLDTPLTHILTQLANEAQSGGLRGRLYVEERCYALASRLLTLTRTKGKDTGWLRHKLDTRLLRRLSERVDATPGGELDLHVLADEAGYSKRQLLRVFRAQTGRSPHQYVLDLRLEKARRLMLRRSFTLINIAIECGFSSHPHFAQCFRQRFGLTPSDFRRAL